MELVREINQLLEEKEQAPFAAKSSESDPGHNHA